MILASNLLAKMASNLNTDLMETNSKSNKTNFGFEISNTPTYTKEHLLHYLNDAYLTIASELKLFKNTCEVELFGDEELILYPSDFLACINIRLNGKLLECKSFEYATNTNSKEVLAVFLDEGFLIFPKNIRGSVKLNYYAFKKITSENDYLYISPVCEKAILFYALFLAYQKLMSDSSLKISNYYRQLFEVEILKAKDLIALNQNSKSIKTRFKIV